MPKHKEKRARSEPRAGRADRSASRARPLSARAITSRRYSSWANETELRPHSELHACERRQIFVAAGHSGEADGLETSSTGLASTSRAASSQAAVAPSFGAGGPASVTATSGELQTL